jgi:hypothetical protein
VDIKVPLSNQTVSKDLQEGQKAKKSLSRFSKTGPGTGAVLNARSVIYIVPKKNYAPFYYPGN